VEKVKDTVGNTVDRVKDTAREAVDTVRKTLDIRLQTERRPWAMFGGAIAVGFVGGLLLPGRPKRHPIARSHLGYHPERWMPERAKPSEPVSAPEEPERPGWLDKTMQRFEPALNKLKDAALGATVKMVGDMVIDAVPPQMREQVAGVIDEFAGAIGAEPIPEEQQPALSSAGASSIPAGEPRTDNRPHNRLASTKAKGGNGRSAGS
jgi:hypothetical protein